MHPLNGCFFTTAMQSCILRMNRSPYRMLATLREAVGILCAGAVRAISDGHSVLEPVTAARQFQHSFTAAYGDQHPHFVELGWQVSVWPQFLTDTALQIHCTAYMEFECL